MKDLKDKVVAITGAGSGIGRAVAIAMANEGSVLAIADVNEAGLKGTVAQLPPGAVSSTHIVDVSNREQMHGYARDVVSNHGHVDIVINNAGVHLDTSLMAARYEDLEWLFGINFWGIVYGSKEFLPYLMQRPEANLCNMSSVHGLFTSPRIGPYCASKFAVRGFTLALAQDLKGTPVNVSCIIPGGVKTNLVRSARYGTDTDLTFRLRRVAEFDRFIARLTPEKAARSIVKGIKRNHKRILVGGQAHLADVMSRLFPMAWQAAMGAGSGVPAGTPPPRPPVNAGRK